MKYRLSELFEILGGGTPKTQNPEYWKGTIPWISVTDMGREFRYVDSTAKTITDKGLLESSTRLLQPDDLIISARGTVGIVNQIRRPMAFNQTCYGLRAKPEIVYCNYLYYLMICQVPRLLQISHGAVFNTITRESFDVLEVDLPALETQKEIAHILGTLDDKIELNRRMNKNLEEIAQALFKHWFIDFEFPNEEGKPYKSSEGEMIDSEFGPIPIGWEIVKLGNKTNLTKGISYKSSDLRASDTAMVTLKSFVRGGGYQERGLKSFAGSYKEEQKLKIGEVVIACTDVTQNAEVIGRPVLVQSDRRYRILIASLDTVIVRPRGNDITDGFIYYLSSSDMFNKHMLAYTSGTTVLHLSKVAIPSFTYAHPKEDMVKKFDSITSKLNSLIIVNNTDTSIIQEIRRYLLEFLLI